MVSTNKTIGKFKVFSCHQCKGLFKENKQELTDEEWAHAWINIIFRMEIAAAKDKAKKRAELVKDYRETFANPYVAAGLGYIDKVIFPHETRPLICSGLEMLASKRKSRQPKKHGNIPL